MVDLGMLFGVAQQGQQQGAMGAAMNLLFNSGQQYQQPRYQGIPGNVSNMYRYQPSLSEKFMNMLFPGTQQMMAPPVFLQSDFQDIMARTRYENQMRARYSENPFAITAAQTALQTFGFGEDEASKIMEDKTIRGVTSMLGTMMFGKSASQQRGDVSIDLNRFFAGRQFRGASGMFRMGITPEINRDLTDRLFRETYRDEYGMFKEMPFFGMQEMSDIMKLGVDYGLDIPRTQGGEINTEQLVEQTKSLAKVIEAGMGIYNTLDKEEVIKNIMEMTRGTVALGETAELNTMIFRINAMAKNANVSMKIMQKIISEGAQIFDEIGISGKTGAMLTAETFGMTRSMTSGPTSVVDPDTVRRAGGAQAMRELDLANLTGTLQSDLFREASSLYGFAKSMGDEQGMRNAMEVAFSPSGQVDKSFFDEKERLKRRYAQKLMQESDISEGMARTLAEDAFRSSTRTGMEDMLEDQIDSGGFTEMMRDMRLKQVREELMFSGKVPEVDKLIAAAKKGGQDSASYNAIVENLTERMMEGRPNLGRDQSRALAESIAGTALMSDERLKQEQDRVERERAIALRDQAMQSDFRGSSTFEKIMNEIQTSGMDTPLSSLFGMMIPTGPSAFTDPNQPTDVDYMKKFFDQLNSDDPDFKANMREKMIRGYLEFGGFSDPRTSALFETAKTTSGVRFLDSNQVERISSIGQLLAGEMTDDFVNESLQGVGVDDMTKLSEAMQGTKGNIAEFIKTLNKDFGQNFTMQDISNDDVLQAYAAFIGRDQSSTSKNIRSLLQQGAKLAGEDFQLGENMLFDGTETSIAQQIAEKFFNIKDISQTDAETYIKTIAQGGEVPGVSLGPTERVIIEDAQNLFQKFPGIAEAPEEFAQGVMRIEAGQSLTREQKEKFPILEKIQQSGDIAISAFQNAMKKQELEDKKLMNARIRDFETFSKSDVSGILGMQTTPEDRQSILKGLGIKPSDVPDFTQDITKLISEGKYEDAMKLLKPEKMDFKKTLAALTDYEQDSGVLSKQLQESAKEDEVKQKKPDQMMDMFKMMIRNVKDFVPDKADKIDLKAGTVKIQADGITSKYVEEKQKVDDDPSAVKGGRPQPDSKPDASRRDSTTKEDPAKGDKVSVILEQIRDALSDSIKKNDLDSITEKIVQGMMINKSQQYS